MNTSVENNINESFSWKYDVNLFKDPTILVLIYKVLFLSCIICFFLVSCIAMCDDGIDGLSDIIPDAKTLLIITLIVIGVGFVGYFLYAIIMGGKYSIMFTMDKKHIVHEQIPKQAKKSKKISFLLVLAGLLAKRPTSVGTGMITAEHTKTISNFEDVILVKAVRRFNMIKVNEKFTKNRVYVNSDDYDFVLDFIIKHCPNAQIKL